MYGKTKLIFFMAAVLMALSLFGCTNGKSNVSSDTLYVKQVSGLADDFILGCDVSSLLAEEASGVKYYDESGNETDMLKTLAANGVNYVRVRIWNDPFDSDGNGYGGGNCDLSTAIEIGKRAKKYGMKLLADFHYSDFWADPAKQMAPKAWQGMSIDEKKQAMYDFTFDAVTKLTKEDLTLGMVQIGNETTSGIAGESAIPKVTSLMAAAADAVRAVSKDVLIAIHFTNPESVNYNSWAYHLAVNSVDYDVFASSYYPYWHGTLENLKAKLEDVAVNYHKKVMVAETQWAYTIEDTDGTGNSIGSGGTYEKRYPFTVQGQANEIRDVIDAVNSIENGIGVFYWEAGWIKVPADSQEERASLWEKYGSGWASSYAQEYDPKDAGVYYGGSACDNQALFDEDGKPLESLKVFSLVKTGNEKVELAVDSVENTFIDVKLNNPVMLPDTVNAVMSDNSVQKVAVTWDATEEELSAMSTGGIGSYTVKGTANSAPVECTVKMVAENYIENYSFEDEDRSMWIITNTADGEQTDYQNKAMDAYTGNYSLHFWNANKVGFTVEQKVSGLREGTYSFSIEAQGGDFDESSTLYIYAVSDGNEYKESFSLTGWADFHQPVIHGIECKSGEMTVGVFVDANGGSWGTFDDFLLNPEE